MDNNKAKLVKDIFIGALLTGIVGFAAYQLTYMSLADNNYIVKVNGEPVTIKEYKGNISKAGEQYQLKMGADFRTANGQKIFDELSEQILRETILNKVMLQKASESGITANEEEIQNELATIKQRSFKNKETEYRRALAQNGLSEDALRKLLKESVILKKFDKKVAEENIVISESDLNQYYESKKEQLKSQEVVKASHILVESEELAKKLFEQLNNGADFAALAQEHSMDPGSKVKGGDLGYFGRGQMVPPFEEAAFNSKVGEITQPVKSDFGFHIIKKTEHKPASAPTFEEVKEALTDELRNSKRNEFFSRWYEEIVGEANIEYNPTFAEFKVPLTQKEKEEMDKLNAQENPDIQQEGQETENGQ